MLCACHFRRTNEFASETFQPGKNVAKWSLYDASVQEAGAHPELGLRGEEIFAGIVPKGHAHHREQAARCGSNGDEKSSVEANPLGVLEGFRERAELQSAEGAMAADERCLLSLFFQIKFSFRPFLVSVTLSACTRSEIVDYTHRMAKYGQEVADKKRPNPFAFEIWDFMQTAKRSSKADISQVIEYEQAQLALEAKKSAMEIADEARPNEEPTLVSDDDEDELFKWYGEFRRRGGRSTILIGYFARAGKSRRRVCAKWKSRTSHRRRRLPPWADPRTRPTGGTGPTTRAARARRRAFNTSSTTPRKCLRFI